MMSRRLVRDWSTEFVAPSRSARQVALVVSAAFAVLAITWVLTTDVLVSTYTSDVQVFARIHLAADWAFILLTGVAVFWFALRAASRLIEANGVLSAVVRSIGDGLLVLGRDRRIAYANPAAVKMLECSDCTQLLGMDAQEFSRHFLVSYPSGALVKPEGFASQRAFDEPGPLRYKAVLHPGPDDELVILSSASGVRQDPDEPPGLVVSVMHDVTAEEHFEQMRDRFFSAAAHALKTPVAIIKANIQLMQQTPQPASALAVQRQCDRIDLIVQNLLVISRARTRSLELYPQPVDLPSLIEHVGREMVAARTAPRVDTEIGDGPRTIRGDRERLLLVIRNLAHEAVLSARPKTPLRIRLISRGGDVELSVHYDPLPLPERTFAGADDHDDSKLGRCATTTIVEAHGGITGEETMGDHEAMLWVRLPAHTRVA